MKIIVSLLAILGCQLCITKLKASTTMKPDSTRKCQTKCDTGNYKILYVVELDALNTADTRATLVPDALPEGALVVVRIRNINPLAATLTIKTSIQNFDFSEGSDVFSKAIKKNSGNDSSKGKKDTKSTAKDPTSKLQEMIVSHADTIVTKTDKVNLDSCLRQFRKQLNQLILFSKLDSQLYKLSLQPIIVYSTLKNQLQTHLACFQLDTLSTSCVIQEKKQQLYEDLLESNQNIQDAYSNLPKLVKINNPILKLTPDKKSKKSKTIVEAVLDTTEEIQPTRYDTAFAYVKAVIAALNTDSSQNSLRTKAENITHILEEVNKYTDFIIQDSPRVVAGDIFSIQATVKNSKGVNLFNLSAIPIKTYGGRRIDFSTGFAFNFGGLLNDNYRIIKINTTDFKVQKNEQHNQFLPSLAAFFHMYRKVRSGLQPAFTFGLSTNPADLAATNFYAGASLIFRSESRFIVSGGFAAGSSTRLEPRYSENTNYQYTEYSGIQDKDLVEKRFRLGYFFGISYNLSKTK